ncbi:MAG TPA: ABC transporter substrate-binding protein [Stellaceae bacterium]|nr:ABC transporter substrate-binding protein [Stellaceae bacterium]
MTARGILRAIALVAALLAAQSAAASSLRVGEAVPRSFTFRLLDFGIRRGMFAADGLTIAVSVFNGPARLQQALAANAVDIGLGTGEDLGFIAAGAQEKAIAAMAGPPLDTGLVVMRGSPLRRAADLKGRKVGASSLTSLVAWMIGEVAVRQGWVRDAIRVVPTGTATGAIALLKAGQIDAAASDMTPALQFAAAGKGRILLRFGDDVKDIHNNIIFATDRIIAAHPDDVRAFLRGWFDTIAFARAHRAETIADMARMLHVYPAVAAAVYDRQMPMYSPDGRFSATAMAALARSLVDIGMADAAPDMARLYTEAFLPPR